MNGHSMRKTAYCFAIFMLAFLFVASPGEPRELTEAEPGKLKVGAFKNVMITSGQTRLYDFEGKFFKELKEMDNVKLLVGSDMVDLYGQPEGYWFNLADKGAPTLFKKFQDQNVDYLVFFTLKIMTWSAFMNVSLVDTSVPEIKNYNIVRQFTPSDVRSMGGFQPGYLKIRRQFYEHVASVFPQTLEKKSAFARREPAPAAPRPSVPARARPAPVRPQAPVPAAAPPPAIPDVAVVPGGTDIPASGAQVTIPPGGFKGAKGPGPQVAGEKWAVVIGVSRYKDKRIPSLKYAARDAKAFYSWLVSKKGGDYKKSHVKLLIDENATNVNMKDALFEWLRNSIDEDMVTIFFAGHGTPPSPTDQKNLFLLPHDADYGRVAATGFPMWDVETALKRFIKAKRVVVLADSCHSGGVGSDFTKSYRALSVRPKNASAFGALTRAGAGVAVLTSADDNQLSQEGKNWGGGHGVFTYFLLEGLRGGADFDKDGSVNLGELIPFVSQKVRRATKNSQSPTVSGKFDPSLAIGK